MFFIIFWFFIPFDKYRKSKMKMKIKENHTSY